MSYFGIFVVHKSENLKKKAVLILPYFYTNPLINCTFFHIFGALSDLVAQQF